MAAAAIEKLPQLKSATDGLKEMRDPLSLPARHHSSGSHLCFVLDLSKDLIDSYGSEYGFIGEPTDATQMPWRAEYAKSSRSSCKSCKSPINKETFRLGKLVQATQFADVIPLLPALLNFPILTICCFSFHEVFQANVSSVHFNPSHADVAPCFLEYVRVNVYELSVDHLTVSEYLRFKEELVNGHRHPEVKWAETTDKIFLTVVLADSKETKFNLDPEGVFDFSAKAGPENHVYELKLELHGKVNVEESKINIGVRSIFCIIEKAEPERWNKLVRGGKAPHYVKIDWDKWVDEDDEGTAGAGDMDMGGMGEMDFSNLVVWPELKDLAAWEAWVVWVAWEGWVGWKSLKTVMMKNLQNQETRKMKPSRKKQNQ
ncbi:uncharacterized protein LOC108836868 [Raphanus sativus]|uniref:Co-chaperone protein p23 n=1 Tax=Raphanus sativus TaxID=3726 RepID=A0A9W3D9U0_RAPSA|nr:uncharacterized protein LOC108836868 [Raphanus sativus]